MKKKVVLITGGLCLAVLTGCGTYGYQQDRSSSEPWTVSEPQEMVMIPDSQVYFVPNLSVDLFFFNNFWWSQRGNNWNRSRNYNGPWESMDQRYVPAPVIRVPRDYRTTYRNERHIPYGQLKQPERNNGMNNNNNRRDNNPGR